MVGGVIELISFWKELQSPFLKDQRGLRDEGRGVGIEGKEITTGGWSHE